MFLLFFLVLFSLGLSTPTPSSSPWPSVNSTHESTALAPPTPSIFSDENSSPDSSSMVDCSVHHIEGRVPFCSVTLESYLTSPKTECITDGKSWSASDLLPNTTECPGLMCLGWAYYSKGLKNVACKNYAAYQCCTYQNSNSGGDESCLAVGYCGLLKENNPTAPRPDARPSCDRECVAFWCVFSGLIVLGLPLSWACCLLRAKHNYRAGRQVRSSTRIAWRPPERDEEKFLSSEPAAESEYEEGSDMQGEEEEEEANSGEEEERAEALDSSSEYEPESTDSTPESSEELAEPGKAKGRK